MQFRQAHAAFAACSMWLATAAAGADATALTLREALDRARTLNPQLAGFVFETRLQDLRRQQARIGPAAEVELLVEDAAGSGERGGFDSAQTTLSLSQLFELGGKKSGRIAVAQAQQARLRTEQAARQLDVAADVARRFVHALAQQERVAAARDAVAVAQRVQGAVEQRVRAAASPEAEGSRAIVATAEARLELEDAQHGFETARFELAAAIGLSSPDFSAVAGELFEAPASPSFDALMAQVETSPDFLRFADEARLRDAELRLAERQRRGDLRATLGVRRFEQDGDTALLGGVSLPLFSGSRAAPAISAAQAQRDQLATQRNAALLKARAHLFAQHQEMEHARHVTSVLTGEVLPQLAKAVEQTEYAYRRGRYSYLEWSDAQRRLLEAAVRRIEAAAQFHIHRIEIERLTGESLGQAGVQP